jgi:HAD superfamily hydrolase (TIGR01548 family)
MGAEMVVFDMDGVLVDPSETFRRALIETVRYFAGIRMSQDDIVRIKNRGGYNDDSEIAVLAIRSAGAAAEPSEVREFGRGLYWGENGDGLIRNERWLVHPGVLERLAAKRQLGIFTGRGMSSAQHTLNRFCPSIVFDPIVTNEKVENLKPAPDGLLHIKREMPGAEMLFVGDNIDDCRSANAAGVRFVGIASPEMPRHEETRALFEKLGAEAVLESVNELEACLG